MMGLTLFLFSQDNQVDCLRRNRRGNRLRSLLVNQVEYHQDSRHVNRRDSPRENLRGYHHHSRQVVLLATQLHDIDGPDPFFHSRRTTKPTAFVATVEATVYAAFWPAN